MADELLPYSLEAFAKGEDFPLRQLSLSISEPLAHKDYGYECIVRCPIVREKPMSIFSYEPLYAAELSIQFVKQVLRMRGIEVVDRNGRAIEFPKFSEFDEVERTAIEDDGNRQGEAVMVSIKKTPDGEKFLIVDDLMKIESEPTQLWSKGKTAALLPIVDEISQRMFAEFGWNIFSRLEIRNEMGSKNKK